MKTKHTPGPWKHQLVTSKFLGRGYVVFADDDCHTIITSVGYDHLMKDKTYHANARLIAAAPELLKALEKCLLSIEFHNEHNTKHETAFVSAKAAIAKATGEREEAI